MDLRYGLGGVQTIVQNCGSIAYGRLLGLLPIVRQAFASKTSSKTPQKMGKKASPALIFYNLLSFSHF
jgi:hypothetical protein